LYGLLFSKIILFADNAKLGAVSLRLR